MLMVCHHLDKSIPEDLSFAESRIRAETVAAEDVLHDIGALSMISSDSQAMGRVGEVISRTWRTASKMKQFRGPLTELGDTEGVDNGRIKRYIAKYTVNPCVDHQGSLLLLTKSDENYYLKGDYTWYKSPGWSNRNRSTCRSCSLETRELRDAPRNGVKIRSNSMGSGMSKGLISSF